MSTGWRRWRESLGGSVSKVPEPAPAAPAPAAGAGGIRTVYDLFPDVENHRQAASFPDIQDEVFWRVVDGARPYTMLGIEALYEIYRSVAYVARNGVAGDLVECGVFLGGSVWAAAEFALHFGLSDRRLFLYDTFCGFPEGTAPETDLLGRETRFYTHPHFLGTVREVLARSAYPQERFVIVEGDVAKTLSASLPERIAILRLDTDDYASTRVELEALYPQLTPGGVLMIDDYGYFRGARRATDEFLERQPHAPMLHRVSQAVRSGVKALAL